MRILIYTLFTLSGFLGLIYEGLWARYLKLVLGHSSYGQILTLSIFMGGLGLGAWFFGKWVQHQRSPFRLYALLEVLIGLGGLAYHTLHLQGNFWIHTLLSQSVHSAWGTQLVKIAVATLTTLPWALFLGGTFPCLAVGLMRWAGDDGRKTLPGLYFSNSLGGVLGILLASYWMIPHLGTQRSLILTGSGNLLIGLVFFLLAKVLQSSSPTASETETSRDGTETEILPKTALNSTFLLMLTAALTGFSSFLYEMGWIRLLSLMLGSSTHSFDIMVSAFILGLASGGLFAHLLLRQRQHVLKWLALMQILMGLLAGLSLLGYAQLFAMVHSAHEVLKPTLPAYHLFTLFKYLIALLLMYPASFCAGTTLPLLTWLMLHWRKRQENPEKWVGWIYAANTGGSILGAVLGGLYLLPLLQLKNFILLGALTDVGVGLILLWQAGPLLWQLGLALACTLLLLLPPLRLKLDASILASGVFLFRMERPLQTEAENPAKITLRHGKTATISLYESKELKTISTNGKPDASVYLEDRQPNDLADEFTQASLAVYPMQLLKQPYHAALIGLGSGMTAQYLLADPKLQHLDTIEIEPEMYRLAQGFRPLNERVYTDPRNQMRFEDARSFFFRQNKSYDLIVSEPSNPWVSGVSGLFTREFYHDLKGFLKRDGYLVQWLHNYEFNDALLMSIFEALKGEFPYFRVYRTPQAQFEPISAEGLRRAHSSDIILIASQQEFKLQAHPQDARWQQIEADLHRLHLNLSHFQERNYLFSSQSLAPLDRDYRANSDYFPLVDYGAESAFFTKERISLLQPFLNGPIFYQELLEPDFKPWTYAQNPAPQLNTLYARTLELLQAPEGLKDKALLDENFFATISALYPMLDWKRDPLVQHYKAYLQQERAPNDIAQLKFALLESSKTQPPAQSRRLVQEIVRNTTPQLLHADFLRFVMLYCLRQHWLPEYTQLLKTHVEPFPEFTPFEKKLLVDLLEYPILISN